MEDPDAFRPLVGLGAAAAAAAASGPVTAGATDGSGATAAAAVAAAGVNGRALLPVARFAEGVVSELVAWARAVPAYEVAFFALAERVLERLLQAFAVRG